MIEYNLTRADNSSINLDNLEDINKLIISVFPETNVETNNMSAIVRKTYGINGNAFHVYYRNKDTRIFIPKENILIKNKIESTGLKCL